ncbi:MAG: heat-inducible transcriptional repressor [Clostridiales bacterium]|jgi:heat-inducible transcriptional repressor|nr:heat-inducible transcriptional repressor [Clostridiales bacterium]MDN5283023.1 heat-inducible transcriptional repressor [Candidatus Ozemobacter sp.]
MKRFSFTSELEKEHENDLNDRQRNVLKEVCDAFINTSVPVGSRTISRSGRLSCSPATIRNEMADLEMMGYLFSPHTSAGRVPTEKGYRFYVNFLLEYERISQLEESLIGKIAIYAREDHLHTQDILKSAIKYACQKTNLAGVLLAPRKSHNQLKSIRLFRVLENKAMLVTVDEYGGISDQVVTIPADTSDDVLEKLGILLNAQLCHHRYHQYEQEFIEKTRHLLSRYNNLLSALVNQVRSALDDPDSNEILLDGFVNFFDQPEFNDTGKMKQMLRLLDQKEMLLNLLAKSLESDREIVVNIGSDSGLEIKDMSVVTARYLGPNKSIGKIGLIGPLRMDYSKVVATLLRLSNTLSQLLMGSVKLSEVK